MAFFHRVGFKYVSTIVVLIIIKRAVGNTPSSSSSSGNTSHPLGTSLLLAYWSSDSDFKTDGKTCRCSIHTI